MSNWKLSRFNAYSRTTNDELVMYNSYTGAIGVVPIDQEQAVNRVIYNKYLVTDDDIFNSNILKDMVDSGLLIPEDQDEFQKATELHENYYNTNKILYLHILPTEQCNFRCVYCYESFIRGKMGKETMEGIKNLIRKRADELEILKVSWFGGEPTEALDVVSELSEAMINICEENGIQYHAGMVTNGYNLTPDVFDLLVNQYKVTSYQITIDGCKEHHDKYRVRNGGGSTYEKIFSNLVSMKSTNYAFDVQIRNNFTPDSYPQMDLFFSDVSEKLCHDMRFTLHFHPVGKWGGPNDDDLSVCEGKESSLRQFELFNQASKHGFSEFPVLKESLKPSGSVCYAGKPWSFVIGSDGTIYKCTVVFDDDRNKVGNLDAYGNLNLDQERFNLWVTSNETIDKGCQKCFFRPSCQGAACPWERIVSGESPCPTPKRYIKRALTAVTTNT